MASGVLRSQRATPMVSGGQLHVRWPGGGAFVHRRPAGRLDQRGGPTLALALALTLALALALALVLALALALTLALALPLALGQSVAALDAATVRAGACNRACGSLQSCVREPAIVRAGACNRTICGGRSWSSSAEADPREGPSASSAALRCSLVYTDAASSTCGRSL